MSREVSLDDEIAEDRLVDRRRVPARDRLRRGDAWREVRGEDEVAESQRWEEDFAEAAGVDDKAGGVETLQRGDRSAGEADWKDLRAAGTAEQRLYSLDAWRESPHYSARERAALAWTESVTLIAEHRVPDEVYVEARANFTEKELADLTLVVAVINAWNRLSIATRAVPGDYQPAAQAVASEA